MQLNEMASKVSDGELDKSRVNRRAKTEVADTDFGMSEDFGFDAAFSDTSSFEGADNFGFGEDFGGASANPFGMQQPVPTEPVKSTEDIVFEKAKEAGKVSLSFLKDLTSSFKSFDAQRRTTMGRMSTIASVIVILVGILVLIFGKTVGISMIVGGGVALGVSIIIFTYGYSSLRDNPPPQESDFGGLDLGADMPDSCDEPADLFDDTEDGDGYDAPFNDDLLDDDTDSSEGAQNNFQAYNVYDEDSTSGANSTVGTESKDEIDRAIEKLSGLDCTGLVSRQALFDVAESVLPSINPDFLRVTEIAEDDRQFEFMDKIVQDAGEIVKSGTTDEIPYLLSLKDKLFYYMLEVYRPKYIKNVDAFVSEITNIFQFNAETGKRDKTIYGIGELVGSKIYVKLMKGTTPMVSLKDSFKATRDFVLDTSNRMPVTLGVDEEGTPAIFDFYKLDSLLITGMPRSGKSWEMQAILYQMMLLNAPSQLNFYILDPKSGVSDFKCIMTPHVKKFVSNDDAILQELRYVVRVEGERRKQVLGSTLNAGGSGYVNIFDLKRDHPEFDMPFIYVIIDEMVALSQRMTKEVKDEFQALLLELVTCLPCTGIRFFGIPHFVKDDVIKKSISRVIPCRVSVRGNAEHIEESCGVKEKDFKHKLPHVGDMCLRMSDAEPTYIHGVALSKSNDVNAKLFRHVAEMWAKLEPQSVKGSMYEKMLNEKEINDLVHKDISTISEAEMWGELE